MTELSALIQNEYKNISFNMEAAQVVSMYNKQRRKKVTLFAGSSLCVIMAISVFAAVNPKSVEWFVSGTGSIIRNLFSGESTVTVVNPTTSTSLPAVITDETENTGSSDSEPELTKETQAQSFVNTDPTEPSGPRGRCWSAGRAGPRPRGTPG